MSAPEKKGSRRSFLGGVAASLTGATLGTLLPCGELGAEETAPAGDSPVRRRWWGMVIDLDLCTGCGGCVVACRSENNIPITGRDPQRLGTRISWMDLILRKKGTSHEAQPDIVPAPCMHCEDPACVKVCPVGATYQNEEGIVAQIYDRCIGCRYCQAACPYSRRYFGWGKPQWPEMYRSYLNPDVSTRPKGVVEKCGFCNHRIRAVRERARLEGTEISDEDLRRLPACAESCPANAIVFGDLNDPESLAGRLARSSRAFRLLEHVGTHPKVYYLGKERQG